MPKFRIHATAAMAIVLATVAVVPARAEANEPGNGIEGVAAVDNNGIAREVRDTIKANYVLDDRIPAVVAAIDQGIADGHYAALDERGLADRLNQDLMSAARDKHLAILFDPARASMIKGPMGDEIVEGPQWERLARSMNHGIAELRVMDGNVRYMKLNGFTWTGASSAAALNNAMQYLGEGDAIIIDLRYNGGGSPVPIQHLFSHFVDAGKPLMTFFIGGGKAPEQYDALADLPAGRQVGKPLYVVTSHMSISAAEAFAQLVKDYQVGDVVGQTTAGASYRNSYFPIASKYLLSVSVGRSEVGPSKFDWEGIGIAPTIPADMDDAVDAAHLAALRRIAASAPQPDRMMMEAKATALDAKLEPRTPAHPLDLYAGAFESRTISLEGGVLYSQRSNGPKTRLLALGGDTFVMEGDPTTKVEYLFVDGRADAMDVIRGDGARQKHARTS